MYNSYRQLTWGTIESSLLMFSVYPILDISLLLIFIYFVGDADGKGNIRKEELYQACAILKVSC